MGAVGDTTFQIMAISGSLRAAPHAVHAHASLAETLRTMSAVLVAEASLSISLGGHTDHAAVAADPVIAPQLSAALDALRRATRPS